MTQETEKPDYAFYAEGVDTKGGLGLVVLLRRALRRLQRPWLLRQVEILEQLHEHIGANEKLLLEMRHEIGELRSRMNAADARFVDHTAIARRLATLEDAYIAAEGRRPTGTEEL